MKEQAKRKTYRQDQYYREEVIEREREREMKHMGHLSLHVVKYLFRCKINNYNFYFEADTLSICGLMF